MTDVGGATNAYEAQSRNMMDNCTTYGFDILIISGSYPTHSTLLFKKIHSCDLILSKFGL